LLSGILGLFVGSFTVVAIEAYKKIRTDVINLNSNCRK
jgi:hypothetical protein